MTPSSAEARLYTIIKVARDEDFLGQIGRDIFFDLVDHDKVRSFRIQKKMPFNIFKEEVAKEFGIPVQFQRFWLWAKRQNHTYRPRRLLTPEEETQSVGQLRKVSKANNAELKLYLEVELGQDLRPITPPLRSKGEILLFFKQYDPLKEELRYVGRLFVKANGKPVKILTKLNELAGFAPDEEIELFEEIEFEPNVMCEHINKNFSFRSSQLEDGDIICFQKSSQVESSEQCRCPDVPSFLEYVHNRQSHDRQDLVSTEAPERVPSEPTLCIGGPGTSPPQQAVQPISGTQAPSVDASHQGSSEATPVGATSTISQAGDHASSSQASDNARGNNFVRSEDAATAGKVKFLSYLVSSGASGLLERIHDLHKDTFAKFSMKGHNLQTMLLESFASFIESILNTKVHDEEALRLAAISIEYFEQFRLNLSWLKQRLDEAKRVNKHSESLIFVDLCESSLKVARAKVCELEESIAKAKAELEVGSRGLPKSLGVDDSLLKDVV